MSIPQSLNIINLRAALLAVFLATASASATEAELSGRHDGIEGSLDADLQDAGHAQDLITGKAQIRWGHRHHRHQHVDFENCKDITGKFQTVDAKCKPTKQAFAAASAMVRYAPSSDGHPRWELLRDCHSIEEMPVEIPVGPSESNAKTVHFPTKLRMGDGDYGRRVVDTKEYAHYLNHLKCPTVVSKQNWANTHDTYGDTFSAVLDGTSLVVHRTDSNGGWGMNLVVKCTVRAPDAKKAKDWRFKGSKLPFGCHYVKAHVSCPCTSSNGRPMTAEVAQRNIITQITGSEHVSQTCDAVADRKNWGVPYPTFLISLKSTVAVMKMIRCWRSKCSGGRTRSHRLQDLQEATHAERHPIPDGMMLIPKEEYARFRTLEKEKEEVLLEEEDGWGGGVAC